MENIRFYIDTMDVNNAVKAMLYDMWRYKEVEDVKDIEVEVDGQYVTVDGEEYRVVDEYEAIQEVNDYIAETIDLINTETQHRFDWLLYNIKPEKVELTLFDLYPEAEEALWDRESYYYWPW